MRKIDLKGQRFGRWTVVEYAGKQQWLCVCDCGATRNVEGGSLRRGLSTSCGCKAQEITTERNMLHGLSRTRLYCVWKSMKSRCYQSSSTSYPNYGGRGICVCDEWLHDFKAFYEWAMANGYDPNAPRGECTIDRIDVNGNYEPSNCQWISNSEQAKNKRPISRTSKSCHSVEALDASGRVVARFNAIADAAKAVGCHWQNISAVCRGKKKTAAGYSWRYATPV